MSATTACLCIAATYVAPLYLWADGPRNEPGTIMRRMGATLACCCVAWVPLWLSMPHVRMTSSAANFDARTKLQTGRSHHVPAGLRTSSAVVWRLINDD